MDNFTKVEGEICVHCGQDAGRPVVPGGWLCKACLRWQNDHTCPTCGQNVGRRLLRAGHGSG